MAIRAVHHVTHVVRELPTRRGPRLNVLSLQEFHESLVLPSVLPSDQGLQAQKHAVHPIRFVLLVKVTQVRLGLHRGRFATSLRSNALRAIVTAKI